MKVDESKVTPAELRYYKHYIACKKAGILSKDYGDQNEIKASGFFNYIDVIKRKNSNFKPGKDDTGTFKTADVKGSAKLCSLVIGDLKVEFPIESVKLTKLLEAIIEEFKEVLIFIKPVDMRKYRNGLVDIIFTEYSNNIYE